MNADQPGGQPAFTVARGRATDADIAAIAAVLLSARATACVAVPAPPTATPSCWTEGSRTRAPLPRPGPHSWRASALPR